MTLDKALQWVKKHDEGGQLYGTVPYSFHPLSVMDIVCHIADKYILTSDQLERIKIVALLHDILEDNTYTKVTFNMLQKEFGFSITNSVSILSKKEGENYCDFIGRILSSNDFPAWIVKLADLRHNMSTLENSTKKDKYLLAEKLLKTCDTEKIFKIKIKMCPLLVAF